MTARELRDLAEQFRRSWHPGRTCRVVPRQARAYLLDAAAIQEAAARLAAPPGRDGRLPLPFASLLDHP